MLLILGYNKNFKVLFRNITAKQYFCRKLCTKVPYKVLFLGSDEIALSSLIKVNEFRKTEESISSLDLVTANKSKHTSVVEKYALNENLKLIQWPIHNIQKHQYDLGIIVAFGHLIRDDILEKFPLGMINVHPSLLPRWRGAAPIIYTLLNGDDISGVTLMKIKANVFDVGEIISQQKVPISKDIKLPELTKHLSEIGAEMLVNFLRDLPKSLENSQPQSAQGVTYAKKIDKNISKVKWTEMTSVQVYNLYRATYGMYTLTTMFEDKRVKLFEAFLLENDEFETKNVPIGTLEFCDKHSSIRILCKDKKYIYFNSLRIGGKKKISALDFYNGYVKNLPNKERRQVIVCR